MTFSSAQLAGFAREAGFDLVGFARAEPIPPETLNDWLAQEFKQRVSRKRKLHLTDKLAEGLKYAAIPVSKREEQGEEDLIKRINQPNENQRDCEPAEVTSKAFNALWSDNDDMRLLDLYQSAISGRGFQRTPREVTR